MCRRPSTGVLASARPSAREIRRLLPPKLALIHKQLITQHRRGMAQV